MEKIETSGLVFAALSLAARQGRYLLWATEPAVGFVDGPQKLVEIGSLVDRECPVETLAEKLELMLRQQANRDDSWGFGHRNS